MITSIKNAHENKLKKKNKDYYNEYYQSNPFISGVTESGFSQVTTPNSQNYRNDLKSNKTNKFNYSVAEFNKFKNKLLFKANQTQKMSTQSYNNSGSRNSSNFLDDRKDTIEFNKNISSSINIDIPPPPTPQQSQIRAIYETIQRSNSSNPKIFSIDLKRTNYLQNLKKTQNLLSSLSIKKIN